MLDAEIKPDDSPTRHKRRAIIICNLGGPDRPESVRPFLFNLFSDRNILPLPAWLRIPLAAFISTMRAPYTRKMYERLGGRSILIEQTEAQARAIEAVAAARGQDVKVMIAMRYWHPLAAETIAALEEFAPEEIVVMPLYPQFSATTTATILEQLRTAAKQRGLTAKISTICCYPRLDGFVAATARMIAPQLAKLTASGHKARLLLSAHGLPKKLIARGDPYQWQVEQTAAAIADALKSSVNDLDWQVCYQSRLGPVMWLGPSVEEELERAGRDKVGVVIAPIAFVSEHLETVVELDEAMKEFASQHGVPAYERAAAVGIAPEFIDAICDLAEQAAGGEHVHCHGGVRLCPREFGLCPHAG
ncbi:MAG: ferrochelatase [Rhodobacteraceae bacterium]|nr:ferrochelatase [Paracoccaceae bacterium]